MRWCFQFPIGITSCIYYVAWSLCQLSVIRYYCFDIIWSNIFYIYFCAIKDKIIYQYFLLFLGLILNALLYKGWFHLWFCAVPEGGTAIIASHGSVSAPVDNGYWVSQVNQCQCSPSYRYWLVSLCFGALCLNNLNWADVLKRF